MQKVSVDQAKWISTPSGQEEQQPPFCPTGCPLICTVGGLALFAEGWLAILQKGKVTIRKNFHEQNKMFNGYLVILNKSNCHYWLTLEVEEAYITYISEFKWDFGVLQVT